MKRDFYIFSDINGVLNSTIWLKKFKEFDLGQKGFFKYICPDNMAALNKLIKILNKKFTVKIVMTYSWKMNMDATKKKLLQHGLNCNNEFLYFTPVRNDRIRGLEIKDFVEKNNIKTNYLVVDDELDDIRPYLADERIIKTDMNEYGLTDELVDKYLAKHKRLAETETLVEER